MAKYTNGFQGFMGTMLPPRADRLDASGTPLPSKITGQGTSIFGEYRMNRDYYHGGVDINYGPGSSDGNPPVYSPIKGTVVEIDEKTTAS